MILFNVNAKKETLETSSHSFVNGLLITMAFKRNSTVMYCPLTEMDRNEN